MRPPLPPLPKLRPMDAVAALYSGKDAALTESILSHLSHSVFHGPEVPSPGPAQLLLSRLSYRLLRATTRTHFSAGGIRYGNRLLERSGHPYAKALLNSTTEATANLVEGGDPMNGPYLMLAPAIRAQGDRWDHRFFNSVQARDVQVRFILETRATVTAAQSVLASGRAVRLKAVAAGTGLSLIMAYDRLIQEGADPRRITALITDRDPANTGKTKHLLATLPSTRDHRFTCSNNYGIAARTEDVFAKPAAADREDDQADILTAIGILEYFEGHTTATTRERLGLSATPGSFTAHHLAARLAAMTLPGSQLILNTYREHSSVRILELFGKRFAYRGREQITALLQPHGFEPSHCAGSANIYDVEVFKKMPIEGIGTCDSPC